MLRIFDGLVTRRFATAKTRVHGDPHLGQLLPAVQTTPRPGLEA